MSYTPPDSVTWKTVSSGTVLLNLESGEYYTLNDTGSLIWSDLIEKKPLPEIVEHLSTEFDCAIETAQADVDEYLNYLLGEKLLNPGDRTVL
jgi:outer membrane protein assembly factor BamB